MNTSESMPNTGLEGFLKVIVGVIEDRDANILLARRPVHLHQGGKWEFPGGKIESHESSREALNRELNEELGLSVTRASPLIQIPFHYKEHSVLLDVWRVHEYSGDARGREGQEIRWVPKAGLDTMEFPPANHAIIAALNFPPVYAISAVERYGEAEFMTSLDNALINGLELLQLREHRLEKEPYLELANKVAARCHRYGARVLLNCSPAWIEDVAADGVHLTQERLMSSDHRPLDDRYLVATSCHDENSLRQAEMIDADFVVLSPVRATTSHPDANPIGWQQFQLLCATTALPVYALGGMALSDILRARQHGAQGVALIKGIWEASNHVLTRHLQVALV